MHHGNEDTPLKPYDCTDDVSNHKALVLRRMWILAQEIERRAVAHDDSKLLLPEKELFDKWTPELKHRTFGSEYYKQALDAMGEGVQHHYQMNRHHPEHFADGVDDMTLVDIIEMLCDWSAAAATKGLPVDLAHAQERFKLSPQLSRILQNTLDEYSNQ